MRKVSSAFLTSACLTWCHPFVRRWLIITVHRNRSHSLQVLTISPSLMTAETLTQRLCYLPLNLSQRLLMPRNLSLIRNWLALSRTRIPSNILIISAWSVLSPVWKIAKLLSRKLPRHAVMENSVKQSITTVNSVRICLMIIPTSAITLTCWRVVIRKWATSPSLLSSIIAVNSLLTPSKTSKPQNSFCNWLP